MDFPEGPNIKAPGGFNVSLWSLFILSINKDCIRNSASLHSGDNFYRWPGEATPVHCLLAFVILVVPQGSRNWPAAVSVGRERVQIVSGRLDYVDDQAL